MLALCNWEIISRDASIPRNDLAIIFPLFQNTDKILGSWPNSTIAIPIFLIFTTNPTNLLLKGKFVNVCMTKIFGQIIWYYFKAPIFMTWRKLFHLKNRYLFQMVVSLKMWIFDLMFVKLKCVWEGGRFFFYFQKFAPPYWALYSWVRQKVQILRLHCDVNGLDPRKFPSIDQFFTWGKKMSKCQDVENLIDLHEFAKSFWIHKKNIDKHNIVHFKL